MGKTPSPAHTSGGVTRSIPASKLQVYRREIARFPTVLALLLFSGLTVALGQSSVESLRSTITSGNVEQKREALLRLRNLHTEEASRTAVPALQDSNDMVRATAAGTVVFLPKQEAISVLLPLLKDKSPFVRKEAAYAVGEVGDPKSLLGEEQDDVIATALRLLLEKDKDPEVRGAAAVAMGKAGGLKSVWYLYFFLQSTPKNEASEFIRRSAVRSVGNVAE